MRYISVFTQLKRQVFFVLLFILSTYNSLAQTTFNDFTAGACIIDMDIF